MELPIQALENLSKNIKFERLRLDISQRKLAEDLNLKGNSTVTHWERGNNYPTLEVFIRLCEYFNRSPTEMLYENLSNKPPNGKSRKAPPLSMTDDSGDIEYGASKETAVAANESPPNEKEMKLKVMEMMMRELEKM